MTCCRGCATPGARSSPRRSSRSTIGCSRLLEKGHTREDVEHVARDFKAIGLTLSPTFVAFTPWTTMESYAMMLETLDRLDLVPGVAPIQYAIRLLVPEGSRMLELEDAAGQGLAFRLEVADPHLASRGSARGRVAARPRSAGRRSPQRAARGDVRGGRRATAPASGLPVAVARAAAATGEPCPI